MLTFPCFCQIVRKKGDLAGSYAVTLRPSRRNSRSLKPGPALKQRFNSISRRAAGVVPAAELTACTGMIAGVVLNGREYQQGDACAFFPYVRPRGNRDGVGGRRGNVDSAKVGIINMFYIFESTILVDLTVLPLVEKCRSLFIVQNRYVQPRVQFKQVYKFMSAVDRLVMHVDSISCKVHLAPHFSDTALLCGIPMWDAR